MLLVPDTSGQACFVVVGENGHLGLGNDGPGVHALVHEVHRATASFDPRREHVPVGVGSGKRREQRRVDVEQPAPPCSNEGWGQQAHPSGQDDDLNAVFLKFLLNRPLVGPSPGRWVLNQRQRNHSHRQAKGSRTTDGARLRPVNEDQGRAVKNVGRPGLVPCKGLHA